MAIQGNFYPGPSKVYDSLQRHLQDAFQSGVLGINHRSTEAMTIIGKVQKLLHQKLHIPADYQMALVSSATECWEIVAQSCWGPHPGTFYIQGSFGEKWAEYTQRIISSPLQKKIYSIQEKIVPDNLEKTGIICLTQSETSNGTQLRFLQTEKLGSVYKRDDKEALVVVDATSSLGGIDLEWQLGDIWFASVQKCLGLPAGMALLVYSPRAWHRVQKLNDRKFYNSLLYIQENMQKNQTQHTPNMLTIFLLLKILEEMPEIPNVHQEIVQRSRSWYHFFFSVPQRFQVQPLVGIEGLRSDTVVALEAPPHEIVRLKAEAQKAGFILGNGYGAWRDTTARIANFPAISSEEISRLKSFLAQ
jgi:phosphoserine aminotransferase